MGSDDIVAVPPDIHVSHLESNFQQNNQHGRLMAPLCPPRSDDGQEVNRPRPPSSPLPTSTKTIQTTNKNFAANEPQTKLNMSTATATMQLVEQILPPTAPPTPDCLSPTKLELTSGAATPVAKSPGVGRAASWSPVPPPLEPVYDGSVRDRLHSYLRDIDLHSCEENGESAFFIADLGEVYMQHQRWMKHLPRVEPFYAVKCNPDPYVLRLLAACGAGFDCASNGEIQSVLDLGVDPSRIIYANPCKAGSFVRHAARAGVRLTTFDNVDELRKIARFHPRAQLVVRILTDDSKSLCKLGLKFGSPLENVPRLLRAAKQLDLDVVGVSFHVGSGCYDPTSFIDALRRARAAFDMGKDAGYRFSLLDVGGGYGHDNFEKIAQVLRPALQEFFPDSLFGPGGTEADSPDGVRIIAEPGRYYVSKAFTLAANIIARRSVLGIEDDEDVGRGGVSEAEEIEVVESARPEPPALVDETEIETKGQADEAKEEPLVMYYANEGVYGAFNCIMFDHQVVHPKVLTLHGNFVYDPSIAAPGLSPELLDARRRFNSSWTRHEDVQGEDKTTGKTASGALIPCSVWGPTCDSIDCVREIAYLPADLDVGDWLAFEDMGAYTICAASQFNGLKKSEVRYTVGEEGEAAMAVRELLRLGA